MTAQRIRNACLSALVFITIGFHSDSHGLFAQNGAFSTPKTLQLAPVRESLGDLVRQTQFVRESPSLARVSLQSDSSETRDRLLDDVEVEDTGRDISELEEDEPTESLSDSEETEDSEDQDDEAEEDVLSSRAKATAKHLSRLRKPICEIEISSNKTAARPENKASQSMQSPPLVQIVAVGSSAPRPNRYTVGFRHRPLYFEQPNLERCGNAHGIFQNALSGAHFIASTIALPYHMGQKSPQCTVPTKGDCYTCQSFEMDLNPIPINRRGALAESAAIAGFYFLLL
jgi:hypothetical protein